MITKQKLMAIIISIIIIISCIYIIVYRPHVRMYGGSYYEGVSVGLCDFNCIYFDQLDISDSAKGNITNRTFALQVTVSAPDGNHSITYNYSVATDTGNLSLQTDVGGHHIPAIEIWTNETGINYTFEISWLVNSSDQEILGLRFLGDENRVTGAFLVNESLDMLLAIDPQYSGMAQTEPDHYRDEEVLALPFDVRVRFAELILCVG